MAPFEEDGDLEGGARPGEGGDAVSADGLGEGFAGVEPRAIEPGLSSWAIPWNQGVVPGYRMLKRLGRGAQSVVYLAEQASTRRLVAIKMFEMDQVVTRAQRARFEREADIVATLKHPGIVMLYDRVTMSGGRMALVLEYVRGLQLGKWVAEARGAWSPSDLRRMIARVVAQIADAVNHAHQNGVAHRDLKPSNILVDRDHRPHVLDFGVAKLLEVEGLTATGDEPATLAYASPEQLEGSDVDQRTDVYSLGVILYEMLAGRRPFEEHLGRRAILKAMRQGRPPSLKELLPGIPTDLAVIAERALEAEPERRYQSLFLLATDLRHFLAGEPIDTRAEPVGRTLKRLAARHWRYVMVGGVAMTLVAAGAVRFGLLYQRTQALYVEATTEKRRADEAVGRLEDTLAMSRVDLGRQLAAAGVVHTGEGMLWEQVLASVAEGGEPGPMSGHRIAALWGLRELYFRDPCLVTSRPSPLVRGASIAAGRDSVVWCGADGVVRELDPMDLAEKRSWAYSPKHNPAAHRVYVCDDGAHLVVVDTGDPPGVERWSIRTRERLMRVDTGRELRGVLARHSSDGSEVVIEREAGGLDLVDLRTGEVRVVEPNLTIRAAGFDRGGGLWLQTLENGLYHQARDSKVCSFVRTIETPEGNGPQLHHGHLFTGLAVDPVEGLVAVLLGGRPWLVPIEVELEAVPIRSSVARGGGRFAIDGRLYYPTADQRLSHIGLETGRPIAGAGGHAGEILAVADAPQWDRLYTVDARGVLKAWPRDLGAARLELETEGTFGIIPTDIEPLRDAHVAISNNIGQVRVVELKSGDTEVIHTAHKEYTSAVSIDESRGIAFTVGYDGVLRRWGYPSWRAEGEVRVSVNPATSVAVDLRAGVWCVGTSRGELIFGDTGTMLPIVTASLGELQRVGKLALDATGTRIAVGCSGGVVVVWEPRSGGTPMRIELGLRPVRRVVWLSKERLLVGNDDGLLTLLDVVAGRVVTSVSGHANPIAGLEDWPEEGVVVSLDRAGTLNVWDRERLTILATVRLTDEPVWELAINRQERAILAVGSVQRIISWELGDSDRCIEGNLAFQLARQAEVHGVDRRGERESILRALRVRGGAE
jgi:tRNA A-37 threonylcarbamoyl transferase component Bud32/WD40 repeat protein